MKNQFAISELIAGLLSLVDGTPDATEHEPSGSKGKQNINIGDALCFVRDLFEALIVKANRGQCSVEDFTARMNAVMAEL
jgi:hypothetical protein